jgi:hypothetical protein
MEFISKTFRTWEANFAALDSELEEEGIVYTKRVNEKQDNITYRMVGEGGIVENILEGGAVNLNPFMHPYITNKYFVFLMRKWFDLQAMAYDLSFYQGDFYFNVLGNRYEHESSRSFFESCGEFSTISDKKELENM